MKKNISTLTKGILLAVCILTFSCKKEKNIEAIIITDCTGAYLRINSKDYKICNIEKIANFTNRQTVDVIFKKIDKCNGSGNFVTTCLLYHQYESWAEILNVKQ
jgi:hypothetical protein